MKHITHKLQMTLDRYHCENTGRWSLKPHDSTDMGVFMHLTNGSISVTVEAWDRDYASVAELHDIEIVIEDY